LSVYRCKRCGGFHIGRKRTLNAPVPSKNNSPSGFSGLSRALDTLPDTDQIG
jgi:hypothetical protein